MRLLCERVGASFSTPICQSTGAASRLYTEDILMRHATLVADTKSACKYQRYQHLHREFYLID